MKQGDMVVKKGQEVYKTISLELRKKYDPADYVTIEVDSGTYFVDKNAVAAIKKAQKKYPKKQFFLAQVGRLSGRLSWLST